MIDNILHTLRRYAPAILLIGFFALLAAAGCLLAPTVITPVPAEELPTELPTQIPEETPTQIPTQSPTEPPTEAPTQAPTQPPPKEARLEDVPYYSQKGLLPTGCELVSAKMVLDYYREEPCTVQEVVDHTLCQYPESADGRTYAPHPENAFIGSPWDDSSFGCFAPAAVKMMNELLPEGYEAVDTSGTPLMTLAQTYIPQGTPVLVWVTIYMAESFPSIGWYLYDADGNPTDIWYEWPANEHCMVLVGYDESKYYFHDPYNSRGLVSYSCETAEKRFAEIGCYSAAVREIS
ncbi:MAG: C39 family peptidase [Oscillospiraceae bacterium]|nr:C39 family peptidase [Oscillospiraceae bacterium]